MSMVTRFRWPVAVPTAVLAVVLGTTGQGVGNPDPARTVILPGTALGPVAIGDERAPIETALGPGRVVRTFRAPGEPVPGEVVRYSRAGLEIVFLTNEASATAHRIRSTSPKYRTPRGIGVGSSAAALRARHPGARCVAGACSVLHRREGFTVETRFVLSGRRVIRVRLLRAFTG